MDGRPVQGVQQVDGGLSGDGHHLTECHRKEEPDGEDQRRNVTGMMDTEEVEEEEMEDRFFFIFFFIFFCEVRRVGRKVEVGVAHEHLSASPKSVGEAERQRERDF